PARFSRRAPGSRPVRIRARRLISEPYRLERRFAFALLGTFARGALGRGAGASAPGITATFGAFARAAAACADANSASPALNAKWVQIANGLKNRRKGFCDSRSMSVPPWGGERSCRASARARCEMRVKL